MSLYERIPNNVNLSNDKRLLRALEHWLPNYMQWWIGHGARGLSGRRRLPAHRGLGRAGRLGALRLRQDAGLPLGHLSGAAGEGPHRGLRRSLRPAGVAGRAGRVPQHAAPHHRHAGRHRARQRRAAAHAGPLRPEPVRHPQSVPGERGGRPPPVGHGLPAALLFRPRRPRGERRAAGAPQRQRRQAAHPGRVQRADRRLAELLHVHHLHRPRRQVPVAGAGGERLRSAVAHHALHAHRGGASYVRGRIGRAPRGAPHLRADARDEGRRRAAAGRHRPGDHPALHQPLVQPEPGPVRRRDLEQRGRLFRVRDQGPRQRGDLPRPPGAGRRVQDVGAGCRGLARDGSAAAQRHERGAARRVHRGLPEVSGPGGIA